MKLLLNLALIFTFIFNFSNCTSKKEETEKTTKTITASSSEGYKLMEQKCFICHFAKPDPTKRNSMIAPPMIRVQQHYKPTYPKKEDFINAITAWVKNPIKENTLMPGAVRKFDVMPHLGYGDNEIKQISNLTSMTYSLNLIKEYVYVDFINGQLIMKSSAINKR